LLCEANAASEMVRVTAMVLVAMVIRVGPVIQDAMEMRVGMVMRGVHRALGAGRRASVTSVWHFSHGRLAR
jgi:hypothetical protein